MLAQLLVALLPLTVPLDDTAITDAVAACDGVAVDYDMLDVEVELDDFELLDGGHSVVIEGQVTSVLAYECLRNAIGLPEWTMALMWNSGTVGEAQTITTSGFTITWRFREESFFVLVYDQTVS